MSLCPNCKVEMYEDGKLLRCTECYYTKDNPAVESSAPKGNKYIQEVNSMIRSYLVEARLGDSPVPWKAKWVVLDRRNYDSGRKYNGINRLLLSFSDDISFVTEESATKKGMTKADGAIPHLVIKWIVPYLNKAEKLLSKDAQEEIMKKKRPFMLAHEVYKSKDFNLPEKTYDGEKDNKKFDTIESFLSTVKIAIKEGGNVPGYNSNDDCIYIPRISQFDSSDDYYRQLFKALAHSTAIKGRLDRPAKKFQSDKEHGKEELIGEIAGAYMCHYFGIPVEENDVAYIDGWMRAIDADAYLLTSAAQQAEKIYKFFELAE